MHRPHLPILLGMLCLVLGCAPSPAPVPAVAADHQPLESLAPATELAPIWPREYPHYEHPGYTVGPPSLRWLAGQYESDRGTRADQLFEAPRSEHRVAGTDLGASVLLNGKTFFYFGDSFWNGATECSSAWFDQPSMMASACAAEACCNDAIGLSIDEDPADGVDVAFPTHATRSGSETYLPLVLPGIHDNPDFLGGYWKRNRDPNYTAPAGVALVNELPGADGPRVLLWFATAVWPQGPIQRELHDFRSPRSYVYESQDGLRFTPLVADAAGAPAPFSEDRDTAPTKFMVVAPVEVTARQLREICAPQNAANEPSVLCELPEAERAQGGVLVFGSGRNYRLSPLYLAFLSYATLARTGGWSLRYLAQTDTDTWTWKSREAEATPVIGAEYTKEPTFVEACVERTSFWRCLNAIGDLAHRGQVDAATSLFGEVDVVLVDDGEGGAPPTLVLLSNHQHSPSRLPTARGHARLKGQRTYMRSGDIFVRTAPLASPHRFDREPRAAGLSAYGPYVIDKYTRFDAKTGELVLWYTASLWEGPAMFDSSAHTQYGAATAELRLAWPKEVQP